MAVQTIAVLPISITHPEEVHPGPMPKREAEPVVSDLLLWRHGSLQMQHAASSQSDLNGLKAVSTTVVRAGLAPA